MSAQQNVTIKKNDGTTDQIWTMAYGSAGDGQPAEWRNLTASSVPAFQPWFQITGRRSGTDGRYRRADYSYFWPITAVDVNGRTVIVDSVRGSGTMYLPQQQAPATPDEATAQLINLLDHAHIIEHLKATRAPT